MSACAAAALTARWLRSRNTDLGLRSLMLAAKLPHVDAELWGCGTAQEQKQKQLGLQSFRSLGWEDGAKESGVPLRGFELGFFDAIPVVPVCDLNFKNDEKKEHALHLPCPACRSVGQIWRVCTTSPTLFHLSGSSKDCLRFIFSVLLDLAPTPKQSEQILLLGCAAKCRYRLQGMVGTLACSEAKFEKKAPSGSSSIVELLAQRCADQGVLPLAQNPVKLSKKKTLIYLSLRLLSQLAEQLFFVR
jgi:hypothetical protein